MEKKDNNREKYKSWFNLKKQMEDLLCDKLKGKITYFLTRYHNVHDAYGRATINYLGKELICFSFKEGFIQDYDVSAAYQLRNKDKAACSEITKKLTNEKWMKEAILSEHDFLSSILEYLESKITLLLSSDNYLLRIFAVLDRRIGKRTLEKIKYDMVSLPSWVVQFYKIRLDVEGIKYNEYID